MHARGHPGEPWSRSTTHVVGVSHGVTTLWAVREWPSGHVLATTIGTHAHLSLAVTHRSLVSLLSHVHGWVWVWGGSALTAKHPSMGVHGHPHVDAGSPRSDGHVVHGLGPHARPAHHLRSPRHHALLHHLHPAHALHVLRPHALHAHPALHLHLASMVAHAAELAHASHLTVVVPTLHPLLHVSLHPWHSPHTLRINMK